MGLTVLEIEEGNPANPEVTERFEPQDSILARISTDQAKLETWAT